MAVEARLFLGPRDGETLAIVEPLPVIEVMLQPTGRRIAATDTPEEESPDYDVALYTLESHTAPGVFRYNYSGLKGEESDHGE